MYKSHHTDTKFKLISFMASCKTKYNQSHVGDTDYIDITSNLIQFTYTIKPKDGK